MYDQAVKLEEDTLSVESFAGGPFCSVSAPHDEYSKLNDLPTIIDVLVGGAPR